MLPRQAEKNDPIPWDSMGFLHAYRDRDTRAVQELNNSGEAAELSGKEVPTAQGLAN